MDGLLALCILGIKQSDGSLIKAALGEMEKRLDEKGGSTYRPDFVSIKALTLVLQGKKNEARWATILKTIKFSFLRISSPIYIAIMSWVFLTIIFICFF